MCVCLYLVYIFACALARVYLRVIRHVPGVQYKCAYALCFRFMRTTSFNVRRSGSKTHQQTWDSQVPPACRHVQAWPDLLCINRPVKLILAWRHLFETHLASSHARSLLAWHALQSTNVTQHMLIGVHESFQLSRY